MSPSDAKGLKSLLGQSVVLFTQPADGPGPVWIHGCKLAAEGVLDLYGLGVVFGSQLGPA